MNNFLFGLCWTCEKCCGMCLFDQINGNVFESSLEEIWQKNNQLIEEQIKNKYNKRCGKCDEYYTFNF